MKHHISYTIDEINSVAKEILLLDNPSKIYIFIGEMGSGKTTLIKSLVKELGYKGNINSPTFSIINEYSNGSKIFHFDFYRIENKNELLDLGIEEYINDDHWCFIEWPDLIIDLLPNSYIKLNLETISENERKITIN
tara:strand:+ start:1633 stop:2043 length:411 start_codon:yes stop_codon:yes gene_type:complete